MRKNYEQLGMEFKPRRIIPDIDRRLDRLERALSVLLDDVANNPLTAVEMARLELDRAD